MSIARVTGRGFNGQPSCNTLLKCNQALQRGFFFNAIAITNIIIGLMLPRQREQHTFIHVLASLATDRGTVLYV